MTGTTGAAQAAKWTERIVAGALGGVVGGLAFGLLMAVVLECGAWAPHSN